MVSLNRVAPLFAAGLITACAGRPDPLSWPGWAAYTGSNDAGKGPASWSAYTAAMQGCVRVGMPRSIVDRVLEPEGVENAVSNAVQRYSLDARTSLRVTFRNDTVVRWAVEGEPTESIARSNFVWSRNQADGFPERVTQYLERVPETPAVIAFAMYRACPVLGMTTAELRASWGAPATYDTLGTSPLRLQWAYGYGVEGQREEFLFQGDSLVEHRTVASPSRPDS